VDLCRVSIYVIRLGIATATKEFVSQTVINQNLD